GLFRELLDAQQGLEAPNHLMWIRGLNGLARAHRDEGDFRQALPLLREALAAAEERRGGKHPLTLTVMLNLAATYRELGDSERAGGLLPPGRGARPGDRAVPGGARPTGRSLGGAAPRHARDDVQPGRMPGSQWGTGGGGEVVPPRRRRPGGGPRRGPPRHSRR